MLFDKVLMEFDVGIDFKVRTENSFECVVLDDRQISENQFQEFKQPEFMHIIYVDQFDDDLWSGYSILEPTKQMKEYRKQDFDLSIPQGKD